jgi:hypothetical protein
MDENPPKSKRKLGRPKLPEDIRKGVTFRLLLSPSMREALSKVASAENMTDSEFVRKLLRERLGPC